MHNNQRRRTLEEIAPGSRLIRVIDRLYNLSDIRDAKIYQEKLVKLNLRHSLLSLEGRLELIGDLIMKKKGRLNDSEKRALNFLFEDLNKKRDETWTFLNFSIDYLILTINEYAQNPFSESDQSFLYLRSLLENTSPAGRALLALSLTGLLMSGCTQRKDPTHAYYSEGKGQAIAAIQRLLDYKGIQEEDPGKTATIEKTKKELVEYTKRYTVKKGDSIRRIADELGIDYREIVRRNNIKYDKKRDWFKLYPGQVLVLSGRVGTEKAVQGTTQPEPDYTKNMDFFSLTKNRTEEGYKYHLVIKGDSLWKISERHQVPIKRIAKVNKIKSTDKIKYGTMLKIPTKAKVWEEKRKPFNLMNSENKVRFLKKRTIKAGHPYLNAIVEVSEEYKIDPRLYASLIWEESWFDENAKSKDDCRKLAQLDPRFHTISEDIKENFRKSLGYLRYEFVYYCRKGFDKKSAVICALAAYNGGNTRIRKYIRDGKWDGKSIETIPLKETREYVKKVIRRCERNYQASL